ncbi:MBL fold metallo-hydrolase [Streptacidiphilus sp. 4-A2]|nr:MBL fold metallo-hydrolase [Streptacidiphilus sp. 4-A2]
MGKGTVGGWREVAAGVFQRRYQPVDVTVCAIVGADGIAVVDTRCSLAEARELREHLRQLSSAPVRWVVNTHAHWDHVWGNAEFTAPRQLPPAQLWAHTAAAAEMARSRDGDPEAAAFKAELAAEDPTWAARMAELVEAVPEHTVDTAHTLDLGDRSVRLLHTGRGHTDGDLVLHLPEADTLLVGDLVEESGPPSFGSDSYPLEWAPTLDALLTRCGPGTVLVPGHGEPVDSAFVRAQRDRIRAVADHCAALHAAGVPLAEALAAEGWAYDPEELGAAVERGYAQLDGALA